jgi:hypothetical protein
MLRGLDSSKNEQGDASDEERQIEQEHTPAAGGGADFLRSMLCGRCRCGCVGHSRIGCDIAVIS